MRHFLISEVGQYHIDADGDKAICQDSACYGQLANDVAIAAVADGVGSQKHSEHASKAAVEKCVEYCKENYGKIDTIDLLKNSFMKALEATKIEFEKMGIPTEDCTLCATILTREAVYCGNSGDSGAIGLKSDGTYVLLSRKQNDSEGRVYTLKCTDRWEFKTFNGTFSSVLVATDGFYDFLFPSYLEFWEPYNPVDRVTAFDYETASDYLDINTIGQKMRSSDDSIFEEKAEDIDSSNSNLTQTPFSDANLQEFIASKIDKIPRVGGEWSAIVDDLTVVSVFFEDSIPEKSEQFSKSIPRRKLMKANMRCNYSKLYPDKELIESSDYVYAVDKVIDLPDGCSIKLLSGDMVATIYPKELLERQGFHLERLIECWTQDGVSRIIDTIDDGDYFTLISKVPAGSIPLSKFFAYKRTLDVRVAVVRSLISRCREYSGSSRFESFVGWIPQTDEYHVFARRDGESTVLSTIVDYQGLSNFKSTPGFTRSALINESVSENALTEYGLMDTIYYCLTGGKHIDSIQTAIDEISNLYGAESQMALAFSTSANELQSNLEFKYELWVENTSEAQIQSLSREAGDSSEPSQTQVKETCDLDDIGQPVSNCSNSEPTLMPNKTDSCTTEGDKSAGIEENDNADPSKDKVDENDPAPKEDSEKTPSDDGESDVPQRGILSKLKGALFKNQKDSKKESDKPMANSNEEQEADH